MLAGCQEIQQREDTFSTLWKQVSFWKLLLSFPGNSTLPTFHIFLHTSDLRIPALTFASLSLLWLTAETSTLVCSIPLYSSSKSGADLRLAKRRLVSSCHACKTLASKGKVLLCLIHCSCEVFSVNRQNQILCILHLLLTVYIIFYHIFGVSYHLDAAPSSLLDVFPLISHREEIQALKIRSWG